MDHYAGQFLVFLATIDPVGTLALFVGFTANASPLDRRKIALRAVGYAAALLVASIIVGQLLLGSLGIRLASFQLAGGIIFFMFGVQMVFGTGAAASGSDSEPGYDVAVFPLAVPSLASPGSILAAVVLTDNREFTIPEQALTTLLLLAVLGLTLLLLLQANRIYGLIGNAGSTLMVRVLGLVLAALAVEMILASVGELYLEMLRPTAIATSERNSLAEVEVSRLHFGEVELPAFHPEGPGSDTVFGFLIRDEGHCVLVDTGVGSGSSLIDQLYQPKLRDLSAVLADAGAAVSDVTAIVNSHLHFDHCGNNSLFPGVPTLVQRAELEAARAAHYTVPEWVDFPGANYVAVSGRHLISPRLELLPTPGHTPGHQSLIVRSAARVDLIVAQAAYTAAEFQLFQRSGSNGDLTDPVLQACIQSNATWSEAAYVESLASLHRVRPDRAFFSHDPVAWTPGEAGATVD